MGHIGSTMIVTFLFHRVSLVQDDMLISWLCLRLLESETTETSHYSDDQCFALQSLAIVVVLNCIHLSPIFVLHQADFLEIEQGAETSIAYVGQCSLLHPPSLDMSVGDAFCRCLICSCHRIHTSPHAACSW